MVCSANNVTTKRCSSSRGRLAIDGDEGKTHIKMNARRIAWLRVIIIRKAIATLALLSNVMAYCRRAYQ